MAAITFEKKHIFRNILAVIARETMEIGISIKKKKKIINHINILFGLKNNEIIFSRKQLYTLSMFIEIINLEIIDVLILGFCVTSKYILSIEIRGKYTKQFSVL